MAGKNVIFGSKKPKSDGLLGTCLVLTSSHESLAVGDPETSAFEEEFERRITLWCPII